MFLTLILVCACLLFAALGAVLSHLAPHCAGGAPPHARTTEGDSSPMRVPRWVYHYRNILVGPPLAYAALAFHYETEAGWLTWSLGGLLVALGVALRVWAQAHIRFRLSGHRHLTTTGPYALVRNPLYIANTAICLGATVASELVWLVPVTLVWCMVVYSFVIRQEETRLLGKYGEPYCEYIALVPRWVPKALRLRGLGNAGGHVRGALLVELPCLVILVPFIVKEVVSPWFER